MNGGFLDFQELLKKAIAAGASDLHLSVGTTPAIRVDGSLQRLEGEKVTPKQTEAIAKEIIREDQYEMFKKMGELDFSYSIEGLSRFRINVFHQRGTVSLSARVIPARVPHLHELNLPPILEQFANMPQGLVLVTGPTGSGKTTTLAGMINYINHTHNKHIVTLEDPIEYLHSHKSSIIDQREVGADTTSFPLGLRAALRQDPDVILIGELRDLETIRTAITAAETGHLVLASLHTTDAPQTIDRIIDVFPGNQQSQVRLQLSLVLVGIISQRLLPRKSGSGRITATEVLVNNTAVANLIRQEKVHQIHSIMQTSRAQGMHTMESTIRDYIQKGLIDPQQGQQFLPQELY